MGCIADSSKHWACSLRWVKKQLWLQHKSTLLQTDSSQHRQENFLMHLLIRLLKHFSRWMHVWYGNVCVLPTFMTQLSTVTSRSASVFTHVYNYHVRQCRGNGVILLDMFIQSYNGNSMLQTTYPQLGFYMNVWWSDNGVKGTLA